MWARDKQRLYECSLLGNHTVVWRPIIRIYMYVGRDGALVESIAFNRRIVGSTPALAVT